MGKKGKYALRVAHPAKIAWRNYLVIYVDHKTGKVMHIPLNKLNKSAKKSIKHALKVKAHKKKVVKSHKKKAVKAHKKKSTKKVVHKKKSSKKTVAKKGKKSTKKAVAKKGKKSSKKVVAKKGKKST